MLVDCPGPIAVERTRYTWLLGAKMFVLGIGNVTEDVLAVTLAKKKKAPKETDEVMELLTRKIKVKKTTKRKRSKKSKGTKSGS